jgi:NADH:ubiquinone oxidoreductase subunit 2 (subunit N)
MTLLVFIVVCGVGALLGLLALPFRRIARVVAIVSLAAAFVAALFIGPADSMTAGEVDLFASWYLGLFVTVAAIGALGLCLLGLLVGWPERLAPAVLITLGALAVAFSATDSSVALVAAAAAATPAVLVAARAGRVSFLADVRLAELRTLALVVAGLLFASIVVLQPVWNSDDPTPVFAFAFLGLGVALAIRSGSVPFHVPAARLGRTANRLAPALILVLIPAGVGLVAVSVSSSGGSLGADGDWLNVAAAAIQIIAVMTLILGAVGALLHDQVEEIGAYSIVQDAAFVLLAFAARNPDAAEPTRVWLLTFVSAKFALLAWVAASSWAFGTSNLTQMRGWIRRAPVLGGGLLLVLVATVGWPGSPVFEARSNLIDLGLPSQLALLGPVAIVLTLAVYGRVLAVGLLVPGERVEAADGERPHWAAPVAGGSAGGRSSTAARALPGAMLRNRTIRASSLVLAIAVMALALSAGGLGATGATQTGIALDQSLAGGPGVDNSGPTPGPSEAPVPTEPAVLPTEPAQPTPTSSAIVPATPSPSLTTPTAATPSATTSGSPAPTSSGPAPTTGD